MTTEYFTAGSVPSTGSQGSSATMRGEFVAIEAGFAKLPTMLGNGALPLFVNSGATALEAVSASTARIRLALGSIATQDANNVTISGGTAKTLSALTTNNVAITGGTVTGLSQLASNNVAITGGTISGTNLGTIATQNANNVAITGGSISTTGSVAFQDSTFTINGSGDATKKARLEVDGVTPAATRVLTVLNQDYTVGAFSRGSISGFTYANNGANSIDISAGGAADSTNAYWITGAALTKDITSAWVVGNAQGMLDTGAVGNSDYYLWAIARSDTGVVDYLGSLSSTAPTMPANYDFKKLIGWFKRVGGTNVAFHTYETEGGGIELIWDSPTLDINLSNTLTTARRTDALKVPLSFSTIAHINVLMFDAASGAIAWIYCPDQTDLAPSSSVAPLTNADTQTVKEAAQQMFIRTSATGTIAARASLATVDTYLVATMGFRWARRN